MMIDLDVTGLSDLRSMASGMEWEEAQATILGHLRGNSQLLSEMQSKWLEAVVWSLIRQWSQKERTRLAARMLSDSVGERRQALSRRTLELLSWPMSGGRPLGDARKSDLETEAEMYEFNARQNAVRALWLRKIAERLGPRQMVKSRFSEAELSALYAEVDGEC